MAVHTVYQFMFNKFSCSDHFKTKSQKNFSFPSHLYTKSTKICPNRKTRTAFCRFLVKKTSFEIYPPLSSTVEIYFVERTKTLMALKRRAKIQIAVHPTRKNKMSEYV